MRKTGSHSDDTKAAMRSALEGTGVVVLLLLAGWVWISVIDEAIGSPGRSLALGLLLALLGGILFLRPGRRAG